MIPMQQRNEEKANNEEKPQNQCETEGGLQSRRHNEAREGNMVMWFPQQACVNMDI